VSIAAYYVASLSQVLPGKSIDFYLNELPYCQGLQFQTIDFARNGCSFNTVLKSKGKSFKDIGGLN